MPDPPRRPDVIASRHDPDQGGGSRSWRRAAVVAAAVLIAAGILIQHLASGPPARPHQRAATVSPVRLTAQAMLHGTMLRRGDVRAAELFLGGEQLRLLTVPGPPSAAQFSLRGLAGPLGPGPAVQQVSRVTGGIVALLAGVGPAGLRDLGDVVFVPVGPAGAGTPQVIARANFIAVAPDGRAIWVQQAGPPWGNGPASSPAWLIDEQGRRLSEMTPLPGRSLAGATVDGLLVQQAAGGTTTGGTATGGTTTGGTTTGGTATGGTTTGSTATGSTATGSATTGGAAIVRPGSGTIVSAGIGRDATIVGASARQVAWQPQPCPAACPVHVTSLDGGQAAVIPLPPHTAVDAADAADFDPAGQRLALPLDTISSRGVASGTAVYVASLRDGRLTRLPGGPVPLAGLPAVAGAIPAGATDVVSVRWSASGADLWIVATDGLYFQAAYWTPDGPLRILPPQAGLAYMFALVG